MAEEIDFEKCNCRNFRGPVTLTLTLNRVTRHTIMHHSSTSMHTPNFIEIGQTFCGRTYVPTDGQTATGYRRADISPSNVIRSTRRSRLNNIHICIAPYSRNFRGAGDRQSEKGKESRPVYLWPPYGIGQAIIFLHCGFFLWPPYVLGQAIIFSSGGFFFLSSIFYFFLA